MSELVIERTLAAGALEPIGDGWTVYGRAVPYGVEQLVVDRGNPESYFEEFAFGAYSRDVAKGGRWVNLMLGHAGDDGDRYLGRCIALEEHEDGLYPSFRINRSHPLAEEARSGELTKWSVSARVYETRIEHRNGHDVRVRQRCGLSHVAATDVPQYANAGVLVARDHEIHGKPAAPLRDQLRASLDKLRGSR